MVTKHLIIFGITFLSLFIVSPSLHAVFAQTYKFELADPTVQICANSNFQVKILINTKDVETNNGDTLITFDPEKLSINSIATANFYPSSLDAGLLGGYTNKYLFSSFEESSAYTKKTNTDTLFATMNLTGKTAGATTLTFDCTQGSGSDSNITRASDSVDILNCAETKPLSLTVTSCGTTTAPTPTVTSAPSPTVVPSATPTIKPTSTPRPTSTIRPTVSVLPKAGTTEITFAFLGIGAVLTVIGLLFIL